MTASLIDNEIASTGIRAWADAAGGAALDWERGEGDQRLRGWTGYDGSRAIETNGDPIWSESTDADMFDAIWKARELR